MVTEDICDIDRYIERLLSDSADRTFRIATASPTTLKAIVATAVEHGPDSGGRLECVSTEPAVDVVRENFVAATQLSELLKSGRLELRVSSQQNAHTTTLVHDAETLRALIPMADDQLLCFETDDETARETLAADFTTRWETALPASVDAPPYSQLLTLTGQCVGESVQDDFAAVFEQMGTVPPEEQPRPVAVAVVLGAKHDLLFGDVVEWMETTTLATQGTVSKFKRRLEERGYVQTEDEVNGVGRPRQRLLLPDSGGADLTRSDVISIARLSPT